MITIGEQFAQERKRRALTFEEISKATKIRVEFLEAIEKGDFQKLPGSSYAQGFVRNYAKFLGLPIERSLALFRREFNAEKSFEVLPKGFSSSPYFSIRKIKLGRTVILVGAFLLVIVGFIIFQYRAAFLNPSLTITSPKENQTVKSLTVEIKGKTDPDTTLFLEREAVTVNEDGTFSSEISLFPGKSTINLLVENRFGRQTHKSLEVTVKP